MTDICYNRLFLDPDTAKPTNYGSLAEVVRAHTPHANAIKTVKTKDGKNVLAFYDSYVLIYFDLDKVDWRQKA